MYKSVNDFNIMGMNPHLFHPLPIFLVLWFTDNFVIFVCLFPLLKSRYALINVRNQQKVAKKLNFINLNNEIIREAVEG